MFNFEETKTNDQTFETLHTNSISSNPNSSLEDENSCLFNDSIAYDERDRLRKRLKYYFMNPLDKWRVKGKIPLKLLFQILKIVFVSFQFTAYGMDMQRFLIFKETTETTFRELLLKNLDVNGQSASTDPIIIYSKDLFYKSINDAIISFSNMTNNSFSPIGFNSDHMPSFSFEIRYFSRALLNPSNFSYYYDKKIVSKTINISLDWPPGNEKWKQFSIRTYLKNNSFNFNNFISADLTLPLRLIYLNSNSDPECYEVDIIITYDNSIHDGQILVSLSTTYSKNSCHGNMKKTSSIQWLLIYSIIVIILSFFSILLCIRSLYKGFSLLKEAQYFFPKFYNKSLSKEDEKEFIDIWILVFILTDVFLIFGSLTKLFEYLKHDFNRTYSGSIPLGISILLIYISLFRYLSFFSKYNMLILTIKKSIPEVLKFIVCASILFIGFSICGWIVLGPYHRKFRTFSVTAECLFSLLNGDDMFETFDNLNNIDYSIWLFSRIYLYIFISLFIYVVLNLLISVILDAWYSINKDGSKSHKSILHDFIKECDNESLREYFSEEERMGNDIVSKTTNFIYWLFCPYKYGLNHTAF